MKRTKKFLVSLLATLSVLTGSLGLVACDEAESLSSSSNTGSSASIEQSANDGSSSSLEEDGSNSVSHEHEYTAVVTVPTCTEKGYTAYTCSCGDSYIDAYVNALEHDFKIYVSNNDATCVVNGTETATCSREGCNKTDTRTDENSALEHDFKNYISDNNATYTNDGTKTATCSRSGCNETDTITDVGTKLQSGIMFKTLSVNDTDVYGKVSNTTETFSFINEVQVNGTAKFVVSLDIYGVQQVATKTIPLTVGDNTVYITETVDDELINVYTVTVRRRPTYEVTFNANGGTSVQKQVIEEDYLATEPQTTRMGYTFTGWDYDFATPITKNKEITANWTANENTPYKVEYYLQNLDDNEYTLHESVELTGKTDTTATAGIKEYTHFTYNASNSTTSGNITPDGSSVLSVYYMRDTYSIVANENNAKAGTSTQINGSYRFDKKITLTATTNAGYTFLGWYDNGVCVSETEEFTFSVERDVIYTATWSVNKDTKYTVNHYLQNLDDNGYTLHESVELTGETDTTATAEINGYTHFTYNASDGTISGNINGDGSGILSVYYTRNIYAISINISEAGDITKKGGYRYGKEITTSITLYLGYDFLGWYSDDELLSLEKNDTFMIDGNIIAKCCVKQEMQKFIFSADTQNCTIFGLKDKSVTTITMPDYVTAIGGSAFKGEKIHTVIVGDGVKRIGYDAFANNSYLTRVFIPKSVIAIPGTIVFGCDTFTFIYCEVETRPSGWSNDWLDEWNLCSIEKISSNSWWPYYANVSWGVDCPSYWLI